MPDVEGCVGVPESKHNVVGIYTKDTLDIFQGFFDVVRVEWFVGIIADLANPMDQILSPANNE